MSKCLTQIISYPLHDLLSVNSVSTIKIEGKPEQRKGKTYMKVTNVQLKTAPENIKLRLDNLFGNKELSKYKYFDGT